MNTHASDINELWFTYELNGCRWLSLSDADTFKEKCERVSAAVREEQCQRATMMAGMFMGYVDCVLKSSVRCAWWVSRPGMLSAILQRDIDSKRNPSDVLVSLANTGWLGVSCKSGKLESSKLCFKNPGVGTIENALGLDLTACVREAESAMQMRYGTLWPKTYAGRKQLIRAAEAGDDGNLGQYARSCGDIALTQIRNAVYDALAQMDIASVQTFFTRYWLDADDVFPRYVKLTGTGSGVNFSVRVEDPCHNPTLDAIRAGTFELTKGGNHGILVKSQGRTLFRMRVKFKSEKLASTVAFTGEPGHVNTSDGLLSPIPHRSTGHPTPVGVDAARTEDVSRELSSSTDGRPL